MSVHRLTPASRFWRIGFLCAVCALPLLLSSCGESEQNGFDVSLPLLEPIQFEEMEEVPPLQVPITLSSGSPTQRLNLNAEAWTSVFLAQQYAEGDVLEGMRVDMAMRNTSFQGAPVTIDVLIESRAGLIVGRDADYVPTTPAACSFTLDPNSSGDDFAQGVNTCLSAWIQENGSPVDFDMQMTATPGPVASSASLAGGFVPKQDAVFSYSGDWDMRSTKQCEHDGTRDVLGPIQDGSDFFELLECGVLGLRGIGRTDYDIDITGAAAVWDACGNATIGVLLPTSLSPGPYVVAAAGDSDSVTGMADVPVLLLPDAAGLTERLLAAANDLCAGPKTTPIIAPQGVAGWAHCGPIMPPDVRTGEMRVDAVGFCSVAPIEENEEQ